MNKERLLDTIKDLIERVYKAESLFFETAADRNICEAELKELWEDVFDAFDELIDPVNQHEREDYEEEIESLEDALKDALSKNEDMVDEITDLKEQNGYLSDDLKDLEERNFDLKEENEKLKEILHNVSEAVNVTWN